MNRWRDRRRDLLVVTVLFVAAALAGTLYVKRFVAAGGTQVFYQSYFEPALNWTCGYGFVRSATGPSEPVRAFLATERDRLECTEVTPAETTREGLYQRAWLYLMITVGTAWRLLGISWSGLAPLFGVFYGTTIAVSYGIFRYVAGPVVAAAAAGMLALSSLHLANLPHLRDYSKAPFVLALVLLLMYLVVRPATARRVMLVAAAYGAVLGVGYGFRSDLLANVPPYLLALAFLPVPWRRRIALGAGATLVSTALFLLVAAPVNQQVATTGSCLGHVTLLGFSAPFTDALRVRPASYDLAIAFNDEVLDSTVTGYANRRHPGLGELEYCAPEYDRVTVSYLADVARAFPADVITRAYAATRLVLNAPLQSGVLVRLEGLGIALAAAGLALLAARSLRLAVFALALLLYFGGYPAAQFAPRHYFHLEVVGWMLVAGLSQATFEFVRDRRWTAPWRAAIVRVSVFTAIAGVILVVPLLAARVYQHALVADWLSQYLKAPTTGSPADVTTASESWETSLAAIDLRGRILRIELAHMGDCDPVVRVIHRTALSHIEWSRSVDLGDSGTTTVLVPLEASATRVRLDGLRCGVVTDAALVDTVAVSSPVLLYAAVPQSWQERGMRLHQTLR